MTKKQRKISLEIPKHFPRSHQVPMYFRCPAKLIFSHKHLFNITGKVSAPSYIVNGAFGHAVIQHRSQAKALSEFRKDWPSGFAALTKDNARRIMSLEKSNLFDLLREDAYGVETQFYNPDVPVTCHADFTYEDGSGDFYVHEVKFGDFNRYTPDKIGLDWQTNVYFLLGAEMVVFHVFKLPQHKPGDDPEDFVARMLEAIENKPSNFYQRFEVQPHHALLNPIIMQNACELVSIFLSEALKRNKSGLLGLAQTERTPTACLSERGSRCQYYELCWQEADLSDFPKNDSKLQDKGEVRIIESR